MSAATYTINLITVLTAILFALTAPAITCEATDYSAKIEKQLQTLTQTSLATTARDSRMISYNRENKINLTLSDKTGSYQTVVRFKTGATEDFDGRYDAYFWMGNPSNTVIYSNHNGTEYSINSFSATHQDGVQLVLNTNTPDSFAIAYNVTLQIEGYSILLIDKLNDELHFLNDKDTLAFSSSESFLDDRFEILHYPLVSTGNQETKASELNINYNNTTHKINSTHIIDQVSVYSINGGLQINTTNNSTSFEVPQALHNTAAILVIKSNGKSEVIKTIL